MKNEQNGRQIVEALEEKLRFVRALLEETAKYRAALQKMDVDAIYGHMTIQTDLCEKIAQIDASISEQLHGERRAEISIPVALSLGKIDPELRVRVHDALAELSLASEEMRRKNSEHTVLIEGTQKTFHLLGNALSSLLPTYQLPASRKAQAGGPR